MKGVRVVVGVKTGCKATKFSFFDFASFLLSLFVYMNMTKHMK